MRLAKWRRKPPRPCRRRRTIWRRRDLWSSRCGCRAWSAQRDLLRGEILRQMRDVPILLSPVSTTTAFRHGEGTWRPGAKQCYRDTMRFSQWLNLTGFPGVSVPVSVSAEGLPIGVQVIGRPHEEELVLAVAERIESGRGPWQAPPI